MNAIKVTSLSTALVVDDDAFSQTVAKRLLMKIGFKQCDAAPDGVEGMRLLAKMAHPPDLIICDIYMPNKDGIEIVQALEKLPYQGMLILMSGGDPLMMKLAGKLGEVAGLNVVAQISKPLTEEQLIKALGLGQ